MAQGAKRLGVLLAAAVSAAAIALALTALMIDRAAVRQAVEAQIRQATGLELVTEGSIDVSVFPGTYVTLHKVGLGTHDKQTPVLTVETMTANLRLIPLLMHRFEIADLGLFQPVMEVRRDASGQSNWDALIATLARTMKPGGGSPVSFSEIRISDGRLLYADDRRQIVERMGSIDLSLAWPSISRSFAATGQFDWRGERIDGSFSINDFRAALSGDRSVVKMRVASALAKFAFDGAVTNRSSLLLEGTIAADSPSLRNALRWAGQEPPGTGGLGRFSLKARANLVGTSMALTNVNVEMDGNVAEGVMTIANNERQSIQATLAAEALDLTPYASTVRLLAGGARDWNRQLFDLSGLSSTDLDMRLSAARVTIGSAKLGRTAIGANLRGGTLALSVGEAQMFGGTAKGSFSIGRADTAAAIKAQFQLMDVDLEACIGELFGTRRLSGRGNLAVALEATGASPFGLAQSLDGSASLVGRDGALNGFNVEQLLRRLERRPLSGGGDYRSGRTPFNTLDVALKFSDGIATIENVNIDGSATRLTLSGTASVPARELDLKGVATLVAPSKAGAPFDLPFVVQGPWDDPLIFPDSESLLRRSPATAPLLDAVRDRKTRDAVQSVIERLTGRKLPAPATEGSAPAGSESAAPK